MTIKRDRPFIMKKHTKIPDEWFSSGSHGLVSVLSYSVRPVLKLVVV
jgi:hypothetical protein